MFNSIKDFYINRKIEYVCRKYNIRNYTINDDKSIDVNGNVDLNGKKLKKLPLRFNRVNGYFDCGHNKLETLEGCPKYVGCYDWSLSGNRTGFFSCGENNLRSLEEGPEYVGGHFYCFINKLISLEGYPEYIGGDFNCLENPIYCLARYFIHKENRNDLVELFNFCDAVQGKNIIYDRLDYFFSQIDLQKYTQLSDYSGLLNILESNGYKIIK